MKTEKKQKGIGLGTGMIIGIAIIYILFGLAIEFVPQFKEIYIIYIAGAIFVVFGIIMIVKYFLTGSYRDIGKYGFSAGVLCVLIGVMLLVRTSAIAAVLLPFSRHLHFAYSCDQAAERSGSQKYPQCRMVYLFADCTGISGCSNPGNFKSGGRVSQYKNAIYYLLIADGVIDLISPIYLVFAIRASRRIRPAEQSEKFAAPDEKKENKDDSESEKPVYTAESQRHRQMRMLGMNCRKAIWMR